MQPDIQRRVCVFCGSRPGSAAGYVEAARALGASLAAHGIGVVYGGASIGVMGALADGALAGGGAVIGVIPQSLLDREVAHKDVTELRVVESMHERKALMAELSDAFITLPGGIGTLEELFEVWTWAHLNIHRKPIGLLNVDRFFDALLGFCDQLVSDDFLARTSREFLIDSTEIDDLIAQVMESVARMEPPAPSELGP